MDLILLRHGIAEDLSADGSDDARQLTPLGIQRSTESAMGLTALIGTPSLILTSPKVRAAQTASLLAKAANYHEEPCVAPVLAGDSHKDITAFLLQQDKPLVIAVGHEPALSLVAQLLCAGNTSTHLFDLQKAGAIGIHLPDHNRAATIPGRLLWVLPPGVLRKIHP